MVFAAIAISHQKPRLLQIRSLIDWVPKSKSAQPKFIWHLFGWNPKIAQLTKYCSKIAKLLVKMFWHATFWHGKFWYPTKQALDAQSYTPSLSFFPLY